MRRGIASLEFVLALPFLLALFAAILLVAQIGTGHAQRLTEARYTAWRPTTSAGKPFDFSKANHAASQATLEHAWSGNWFFEKFEFNEKVRYVVLVTTWDHREVKFDQSGLLKPDPQVAKLFALQLPELMLSQIQQIEDRLDLVSSIEKQLDQVKGPGGDLWKWLRKKANTFKDDIKKDVGGGS